MHGWVVQLEWATATLCLDLIRKENEIVLFMGQVFVYTVAAPAMMLAAIERYFMLSELSWPGLGSEERCLFDEDFAYDERSWWTRRRRGRFIYAFSDHRRIFQLGLEAGIALPSE